LPKCSVAFDFEDTFTIETPNLPLRNNSEQFVNASFGKNSSLSREEKMTPETRKNHEQSKSLFQKHKRFSFHPK
jgi:hypothetical protein